MSRRVLQLRLLALAFAAAALSGGALLWWYWGEAILLGSVAMPIC